MKRHTIYNAAILASLVLLSACGKDQAPDAPQSGEMVEMSLAPATVDNGDAAGDEATKASMNSGNWSADYMGYYPPSWDLGIFVMKTSAPTQEHADGYTNILAQLTRPTTGTSAYRNWNIHLPDGKVYRSDYDAGKPTVKIPLYKDRGNIDFYSYFPYVAGQTSPTNVPFDMTEMRGNISALNDYMYFAKTNCNPATAADMAFAPNYRHVMSSIRTLFNTVTGAIGNYCVSKIKLETEDGGSWIPYKGTFNATNGTINTAGLQYTNEIEFSYNTDLVYFYGYMNSSGGYSRGSNYSPEIILPPIATTSTATNRKLKMTVYLNKHEPAPLESGPIILDLSKFSTTTTGGSYGLTAGYRYTMTMEFDPSLRFINFDYPDVIPWGGQTINIKI
ncbi:hypothetical protein FACS1894159_05230 [Bacteroidia bacterium]|nr:hypothetical protein FACS1894159_05230 [Bacteroidia bacterium]